MIDILAKHEAVPRYRLIIGFLAVYLIWGSTYLAIRFTIETIPALLSAGVRFLAGGALLYAYARFSGAVAATKLQWRNSAIIGLLLVVGGTGTVTWAEQFVPSGLAALMVAAMPFWMVLIEWLRPQGKRPVTSVVLGLVFGIRRHCYSDWPDTSRRRRYLRPAWSNGVVVRDVVVGKRFDLLTSHRSSRVEIAFSGDSNACRWSCVDACSPEPQVNSRASTSMPCLSSQLPDCYILLSLGHWHLSPTFGC